MTDTIEMGSSLCYKTITSQNVPSEVPFCFLENLCSVLEIFKFLYFLSSHDLPNL